MIKSQDLKHLIMMKLPQSAWITSEDIRNSLIRYHGVDINDVELRSLIREMNFEGEPIISSTKGFKLASHPSEVIECENVFKSRIRELSHRLKYLREIRKQMQKGQTELPF